MKILFLGLILVGVSLVMFPADAAAQRDYFTPEEVELIRDAQQIDERIAVLTYAIDRRFAALKIDVSGPKIAAKDSEKWGAFPTGTRHQLLLDIKRILQKAIDDIDGIAERPDSMIVAPDKDPKKVKGYAELFPKAVRSLAKAAERYRPALKVELDREQSDAEKGSLLQALDSCDQIIAAVPKLPADAPKKKDKNR